MAYTIQIKNDSGSVQTWAGKEFAIGEEYTVPTDSNRIKYQTAANLLTAIGNSEALIGDGTEYFSDVNKGIDWLKGHDTKPKDTDGAPLARNKITRSGWHFQGQSIELTTSLLNGIYNKNVSETDLGFASVKCYDSGDTELTTQASIDSSGVKTVLTWEPTHDIEMIGGDFYQSTQPTTDTRIWVTAIPDLPAPNGTIPFLQGGHNLRHMGTGLVFRIDGRTPKLLPYDAVYHTSKFEICLRHTAGHQHTIMFTPELFKVNS